MGVNRMRAPYYTHSGGKKLCTVKQPNMMSSSLTNPDFGLLLCSLVHAWSEGRAVKRHSGLTFLIPEQ